MTVKGYLNILNKMSLKELVDELRMYDKSFLYPNRYSMDDLVDIIVKPFRKRNNV